MDCRTTLTHRREQHSPGHEVISLRNTANRDRLVKQVWGKLIKQAGKAPLASAVSFLTAIMAIAGVAFLVAPGKAGIGLLMFLLASIARYILSEINVHITTEHRERLTPLPGVKPSPRLAGGSSILGTVTGGNTAPSPIAGNTLCGLLGDAYGRYTSPRQRFGRRRRARLQP